MSQILIVDQVTGVYHNVDCNGHKFVDPIHEVTGERDCTVFMERMMAGYIDLPLQHQAVQLDLTDSGWGVARVIHYRDESIELQSTTFKPRDCSSINLYDLHVVSVYNYNDMSFMWLENPIGETWCTPDFTKASRVSPTCISGEILHLAKDQLVKELPQHAYVITSVLM